MMPSIDLRLATLRRAVNEVILPAIAPDNALAREQAQLVAAHLELLARQLDDAPRIDAALARGTAALALALVAHAAGGPCTQAAASALNECANAGDAAAPGLRRAQIAAAIDAYMDALAVDGDEAARQRAHDLIIEHALNDGRLERVSFAGNGLDPERAELPCLDALLAST